MASQSLVSLSPDTKSVDVGSMFLIDLSVEESCDLLEDTTNLEDSDAFRALNYQHRQNSNNNNHHHQQQDELEQQLQQYQLKQATTRTASKTIATASKNNSLKHQHQIIIGFEDDNDVYDYDNDNNNDDDDDDVGEDEENAEGGSVLSSFDPATDVQMPPSNAVSYSDQEFLEQEYNDNHHNHYSTDESDDEPLSAEDNPMKLFESIQALARSLHEDAELFGSLPPKRTLESPIRSLLLT